MNHQLYLDCHELLTQCDSFINVWALTDQRVIVLSAASRLVALNGGISEWWGYLKCPCKLDLLVRLDETRTWEMVPLLPAMKCRCPEWDKLTNFVLRSIILFRGHSVPRGKRTEDSTSLHLSWTNLQFILHNKNNQTLPEVTFFTSQICSNWLHQTGSSCFYFPFSW